MVLEYQMHVWSILGPKRPVLPVWMKVSSLLIQGWSLPFLWQKSHSSKLSRISLSVGGDDITEFLYVLLDRICFPYRDINLAKSYDWNVMEDLKARICTLLEASSSLFRNLPLLKKISQGRCSSQLVRLHCPKARPARRKIQYSGLRWDHSGSYGKIFSSGQSIWSWR